jgi:hypothetical protein
MRSRFHFESRLYWLEALKSALNYFAYTIKLCGRERQAVNHVSVGKIKIILK